MDETLVARAKAAANPFDSNRVDSAWDPDAVDVPSINRTAFELCWTTIDMVRSTGQSRGLLLTGERGSGKTHLLQRLRRHVQQQDRDCFVYVPPVSGPDRFFRDLLAHTVHDFVVGRTTSPVSQLESVLVRALFPPKRASTTTAIEFWNDLRRRYAPGEALFRHLQPAIEKLALSRHLEPDTARVLRHYLAAHHRHEAYAWLLGRSIPDSALERLGVGRTLEDDHDARQALFTLSRLAGDQSVFIFAFDQLEGLQVRPEDQEGLRAFGSGIADLLRDCRNVAAISCVQAYFRRDLEHAVSAAHMDRLAQDQGALTLLERTTAVELVAQRLDGVPELREARLTSSGQESLWPLDRADIERVVTRSGIAARQLLNHCRERFAAWRQGAATRPARSASESLDEIFAAQIERAATEPPDEGAMADGLLKLLDAQSPGRARRSDARDVDLIMSGHKGDVGVAVCYAQNMTSLAARFKRLQSMAAAGTFKRLVIVRDERLPVSVTARTTRERLSALEHAGHVVVRPPAEAYAAIAAARRLLAEAAAGDLNVEGRQVAPDDLKQWLAGNVGAAVTTLLEALDAAAGKPEDELLVRLQEVLEGEWIARAAEIAPKLGIDESTLVKSMATGQRLVGVICGPPAVLFLRPDALQRD